MTERSRLDGVSHRIDEPQTEQIEFIQIAAAKDHLYGLTRAGAVWRYDDVRRLWESLSTSFAAVVKKPSFDGHERT
jgi:hypothetical protein